MAPAVQLPLFFSNSITPFNLPNFAAMEAPSQEKLSFDLFKSSVLRDFKLACLSREISLLGRKEVLSGKAKFGIFGDGKEIAQVAMAKFFKPGDFRSGYYRDQTFILAAELGTGQQLFSQLYADADLSREPFSGGRQMNNFFATPFLDATGEWLDLTKTKNSSSDIAPTAGQMPRALGLAHASSIRIYQKRGVKFALLPSEMLPPVKGIFGKQSMRPLCCKFLWLYLCGTTDMEFLFQKNIKPQRVLFLKHWLACSEMRLPLDYNFIVSRDGIMLAYVKRLKRVFN
jgi:hypothetical protein